MTWIGWTYLPTEFVVLAAWVILVASRRYLAGWALAYVMRGVAVIAAVTYAAAGLWPSAAAAGGFILAALLANWLHGPSGPRELWQGKQ